MAENPAPSYLGTLFGAQPKVEIYDHPIFLLQYNAGTFAEKKSGKVIAIGSFVAAFKELINIGPDGKADMDSVSRALDAAGKPSGDWAIILLDQPIETAISFPELVNPNMGDAFDKIRSGSFCPLGYPGEINNGETLIRSKRCSVKSVTRDAISMDCYMYWGMSGGPGIIEQPGVPQLIGIVSRLGDLYNQDTLNLMAPLMEPWDLLSDLVSSDKVGNLDEKLRTLREQESRFLLQ